LDKAEKTTLEQIACAPPLRMQFCAGATDHLVAVFSGVGGDHRSYPPIEFFAAATQGGQNNVLFISDLSRSWLNAPGVDRTIIETIKSLMHDRKLTRLSLLGNSMGATMALYLAPQLDAQVVIALTPQYAADPATMPEETRWLRFRNAIDCFKYDIVPLHPQNEQLTYIVHAGSKGDLRHAQEFPVVNGVRHFILPGYKHNFASVLKEKNLLSPLINAALTRRPYRFRRMLEKLGGKWRSQTIDPASNK
jgi:hypothetical protein